MSVALMNKFSDIERERAVAAYFIYSTDPMRKVYLESFNASYMSEEITEFFIKICQALVANRQVLSPQSFRDYLKISYGQRGELYLPYLETLEESEECQDPPADLQFLEQAYRNRKVQKDIVLGTQKMLNDGKTIDEIASHINAVMNKVVQRKESKSIAKLAQNTYDQIIKNQKTGSTTLRTGLSAFDVCVGLRRNLFVAISAKAGVGKTMVSIDLIRRLFTYNYKIACKYFSLELTEEDFGNTFFANLAQVTRRRLRGHESVPKLDDNDMIDVASAKQTMQEWDMDCVFDPCDPEDILMQGLLFISEHPDETCVIVIDHHMEVEGVDGPDIRQVTARLANACKKLKDAGALVILLCQQTDSLPDFDKKGDILIPELKIHEGASIKKRCDVGIVLLRPAYVLKTATGEKEVMYFIIAKNRSDQVAVLNIMCEPKYNALLDDIPNKLPF